jgi:hypothetical protein
MQEIGPDGDTKFSAQKKMMSNKIKLDSDMTADQGLLIPTPKPNRRMGSKANQ